MANRYLRDSQIIATGWIPADETWTYSSADSPIFVATVSGNQTSKYWAGQRVKLTQTTDKYFIIHAVSYSAPNTLITLYGGTDYTLTSATITSPYYSVQRVPQGFPFIRSKWIISYTNNTEYIQSSPTAGQYYNFGSSYITLGIGQWRGVCEVTLLDNVDTLSIVYAHLSQSDSSLSSPLTLYREDFYNASVRTNHYIQASNLNLSISSKTSYYFLRSASHVINYIGQRYLYIAFESSYL